MRLLYIAFISTLSFPIFAKPGKQSDDLEHYNIPLDERQLGPIGLTILGALTLPILIPVGVARLVSRLTNLGNSTSSTGVTVRPVILPGRPIRRPIFGNSGNNLRFRRSKYRM